MVRHRLSSSWFAFAMFASALLPSSSRGDGVEWSEDQTGGGAPDTFFSDFDKDGSVDLVYTDLDLDGNAENAYLDADGDGTWDVCAIDADDNGVYERVLVDLKPDGTAGGDGMFNGEWLDVNGDGDCEDPGELGEIPPEPIPNGPLPGGVLVCHPSPDCFAGFAQPPNVYACLDIAHAPAMGTWGLIILAISLACAASLIIKRPASSP